MIFTNLFVKFFRNCYLFNIQKNFLMRQRRYVCIIIFKAQIQKSYKFSIMGNEKSTLSRQREKKQTKKFQIVEDYRRCYEEWKNHPNFLSALLCENEKFTNNLLKYFPHARNSYEDFLEMIYYLRKYDQHLQRHQNAINNIPHTTLLDRFFMICLGLNSHQDLESTSLNTQRKEELLIQYMKFFIENPQSGFLAKISDFISIPMENSATLKEFSSAIRQHLPHAQKHLKDYYMIKFRDMQKNGHLLKNFDSKILKEDGVLMSMKLDRLCNKEIKMLYSSETCGLSFHSIYKQIVGYTGPWLLVVEHYEKDKDDKSVTYKFGSYQSGPIRDSNAFQGNLEGFLFSIQPKIRFMTTDKGENGHFYFYINTIDEKLSKIRKGIGFGGDKYKENFKLWIDEDLDKSKVHNGNDATYGYGSLASFATETLNIRRLQIWGLGSIHDLKHQEEYWKQRNEEIMRRRKVNKMELLDGNAGLVFEKTFAHRDQVYGQIERTQKEQRK